MTLLLTQPLPRYLNLLTTLFTDHETVIEVKPVKINFTALDEKILPGEWIRVLPRYLMVW